MDDLIVFAMKEEAQGLFEKAGHAVTYTGLGKVNAAYTLTKALTDRAGRGQRTRAVINFGTAGSPVFPTHSLIECTHFVQRDMDASALGFAIGTTPFETYPPVIEFEKRLKGLRSGRCGSGDSFETGKTRVECNVIDMEAFALAKICHIERIPFLSVKYISDGSDHNAHDDWAANLPKAAARFLEVYETIEAGQLIHSAIK